MTHLVRIPAVTALGVAAAIALAACSSGGSPAAPPTTSSDSTTSSSSSSSSSPATTGKTQTATETEFHIALASETLKAGTYTFDVKNAGSITHALSITGPGVDDKSTGDISPGASAKLTVTLQAGSYDVFCPVGNHKMEGMDETVTVS